MSAKKDGGIEYLYDNDRWRVVGSKPAEIFQLRVSAYNGIIYGQLYYFPHPKLKGVYLFGGLPNVFAPMFKEFVRSKGGTIKKIRRRNAERVGPSIVLWW